MDDEAWYRQERERMVVEQLAGRDIWDRSVLEAMRLVPRHEFVPQEYRHLAYADSPLPIGNNQTISQPYIVALMLQLLELRGGERVLEIGTGSGYQAALLSILAGEVHTVELHPELASRAEQNLTALNFRKIQVHAGDGSKGWPEFAPYDGILVAAAAPEVPKALFDQLASAGRLAIPVGGRSGQNLELWQRRGANLVQELVAPVAFVPLLGEFGWEA